MAYAKTTDITCEESESQIKRMLRDAGATEIATSWVSGRSAIAFRICNLSVKMILHLPDKTHQDVRLYPSGKQRPTNEYGPALEQLHRSYWRSLYLVLKAKLEAVERGISTLEREFLPDVLLPSGETIAERIAPQMEAIKAGKSVNLFLEGPK